MTIHCLSGSGVWVRRLQRKCSCPDGQHQLLMHTAETGSITGNKELLKASGAYPPRFGAAVIAAWEAAGPVCAALREAAANTEWTKKTSSPVDVQQDKKRETPKKKKSPWDSQEFLGDRGSALKKTRRSSPWDTEQPEASSRPEATSRPSTSTSRPPKANKQPTSHRRLHAQQHAGMGHGIEGGASLKGRLCIACQ